MTNTALFMLLLQATTSESENLAKALEAVKSISRVDCSDPAANCPSNQSENYRLPLPVERDVRSAKDALENDGSACAVIGQTICKTEPRPILRSNETPEENAKFCGRPGVTRSPVT